MNSPPRSPGIGFMGDFVLSQPTWITDCDLSVDIVSWEPSNNGSVFTGYIVKVSCAATPRHAVPNMLLRYSGHGHWRDATASSMLCINLCSFHDQEVKLPTRWVDLPVQHQQTTCAAAGNQSPQVREQDFEILRRASLTGSPEFSAELNHDLKQLRTFLVREASPLAQVPSTRVRPQRAQFLRREAMRALVGFKSPRRFELPRSV